MISVIFIIGFGKLSTGYLNAKHITHMYNSEGNCEVQRNAQYAITVKGSCEELLKKIGEKG